MKKPDSVVMVPGNIDSFFRKWFEFLEPFHRLTDREMEVAAAFVKKRYNLSKVITDTDILDKVLMNNDVKEEIRKECNITLPYFQVIMSKLRKNQVIISDKYGSRFNHRFIPNIEEESGAFKLLLYFTFK